MLHIAAVCGDLRQKYLIETLAQEKINIKSYGFDNISDYSNIKVCSDYAETLKDADVVIAPIPFSKDERTLFTINEQLSKVYIEDFLKKCTGKILFAGVINSDIKKLAEENNVKIFDLLKSEENSVYNAIPTAEGAIEIAMKESDITINSSSCAVLGFGRCGKALAKTLNGLGANVYVYARKDSDIAYAKMYGYKILSFEEIHIMDFIFNTVPYEILDRKKISLLKKECIIIDIASAPGGTDFNAATDYNIKALFCPSLPGRVAPKSVAENLKAAIIKILKKEGGGLWED